jgi:hypothetical protein
MSEKFSIAASIAAPNRSGLAAWIARRPLTAYFHALWHLPAYIAPGFLSPGPFDLLFFIANSLSMIALTCVWTWLFNNARGSILFAMRVHAGSNAATTWIGQLSSAAAADGIWAGPLVFAILATLVIALTRGRLSFIPQEMALGEGGRQ